mgnify:CR=1 FL=1
MTLGDSMCEKNYNNYIDMPVVPLRGLVVFPEMVLHFDVGRKKSIAAIKEAMKSLFAKRTLLLTILQ